MNLPPEDMVSLENRCRIIAGIDEVCLWLTNSGTAPSYFRKDSLRASVFQNGILTGSKPVSILAHVYDAAGVDESSWPVDTQKAEQQRGLMAMVDNHKFDSTRDIIEALAVLREFFSETTLISCMDQFGFRTKLPVKFG